MEANKINSVTAQEMRNQLSDLINRAAYLKEPTLVTRQGKAVAVLVAVPDWEEYIHLKRTASMRAIESVDAEDEEKPTVLPGTE